MKKVSKFFQVVSLYLCPLYSLGIFPHIRFKYIQQLKVGNGITLQLMISILLACLIIPFLLYFTFMHTEVSTNRFHLSMIVETSILLLLPFITQKGYWHNLVYRDMDMGLYVSIGYVILSILAMGIISNFRKHPENGG